VFISYARKDGATLARMLSEALATRGLEPWLDTRRVAGGATWTREIERAIDRADVVLALLTTGSYLSEICRAEQLRSLRKGKCVIPLLAEAGAEIPLHLETKNYRNFAGASAFDDEFEKLLTDVGARGGVELKAEYRETYVTAPPLPPNFLTRPDALDALRHAILAEGTPQHVALTAFSGMGGIGKTLLAQALCHDDVVQQAFPDGIVWIPLGKERADLLTLMREVGKGLRDDLRRYDTALAAVNQYRTALRTKAALIVLDDVWNANDLEPFRAQSRRSRLLLTTRDTSIAAKVGARAHTAGLLTEEQSRALLALWSGRREGELPPQSEELIRECGHLPLALAVVGAMLNGAPVVSWQAVLDRLRNVRPEDLESDSLHVDLFRAVQVSVESLDTKTRDRYVALAALLDDMAAPIQILQTLWGADEADARLTARRFASLSLAQPAGDGIQLHDLQMDYVRALYPHRPALGRIHAAVRLSAHIIAGDPAQFAGQLTGRLVGHREEPAFGNVLRAIARGAQRPWLRPLHPGLAPAGGTLVRTLTGHSRAVYGVSISADGRRAVSASEDQTLKVWDLETGADIRTLVGHTAQVLGVTMSRDGRRAVSAASDGILKVWNLDTEDEPRALADHIARHSAVAVTGDWRRLVSEASDGTLKVWDLETGGELGTLADPSEGIHCVAVSHDGRTAVSASRDGTLKAWDVDAARQRMTFAGQHERVSCLALSDDGRTAVSASHDNTLKVWDVTTGRERWMLSGHSVGIDSVVVTGDGRRAVSAARDRTLKVWDLDMGRELCTITGAHSHVIQNVAVTPDGRRAVSGSWDRTMNVWDLGAGQDVRGPGGHSAHVQAVAVTEDGRHAASACKDRSAKVWDVETGRVLRTLPGRIAKAKGAVAVAGQRAVSACWDGTLKLWSMDSGRVLRTLRGHSDTVSGLALDAEGKRCVSASWDQTLRVWDLGTGRLLRTLTGHTRGLTGVAVSRDGGLAVSASWDGTAKVWSVKTGRELCTLSGHSHWVNGVAMSQDGALAVSASEDQSLKVWHVETGRELRTLIGHAGAVKDVAIAGDGRLAVSASEDHTLKVWDLEAGVTLSTFTCEAPVLYCAFGDGHIVVAADDRGNFHMLSLEFSGGSDGGNA